ncbi:hypothetical protein FOG18_03055 [Legionella israelensis]|uniref:hypothetical protein n=1 Tax=Legionella israelensis TaxID=454 RepID=UPI0011811F56|nr:hypothetical protein [Legionella israelensis]QDP71625.1 hypothetical protein FOG18_03055 [Legionella israelensis]
MKPFLLTTIAFSCLLFSLNISAADKVVITGEPVVVHEIQGVYVPTTTVVSTRDYYYLTISGTNRVCYDETNPALVDVNVGEYRVRLGDHVVTLHCYEYSPQYFIVE